MENRILELEGVHNFRDYGGYRARGGAHLKRGILWRSGQHQDATPDDLDRIDGLEIETVIDLRGDSERRKFPCARSPQFSAIVLHSTGETVFKAQVAPHIAAAASTKTVEEAHQKMIDINLDMPYRDSLVATFTLYFDALVHRDGPSLLHCVAGKDRTGLGAALLHLLLGVHEDDVMEDYLLTNTAGNIERRISAGASTISHHFGEVPEAVIRKLMSVHPDYLRTALSAIRESHGTVAAYAEAVWGVTPQVQAALEQRFLA